MFDLKLSFIKSFRVVILLRPSYQVARAAPIWTTYFAFPFTLATNFAIIELAAVNFPGAAALPFIFKIAIVTST